MIVGRGIWGLSRIIEVEPSTTFARSASYWTTVAQHQHLGNTVQAYHPPREGSGFALPYAVICMPAGAIARPADGVHLLSIDALQPAGMLSLTERNALRSLFESLLGDFSYADFQGVRRDVGALSQPLDPDRPIAEYLDRVLLYLQHSVMRSRTVVRESHNTEYLDDFSGGVGNFTVESQAFVHDAGNEEGDVNFSGGNTIIRYSANDPGSIEHESQVTAIEGGQRYVGAGVRHDNTGVDDCYCIDTTSGTNLISIVRVEGGTATELQTTSRTYVPGNFMTSRLAAAGAAGENVVLSGWYLDHTSTKPADPDWIGDDESPDFTYTDSAANRLDAASHIECGIGGRTPNTDYDTRHDFWKSRAISDRVGGSPTLDAEPGSMSITGADATFDIAAAADAGSASFAGADAGLLVGQQLLAEAGAIALSGGDVNSFVSAAADPGTIELVGQDSSVVVELDTEPGAMTLSGGTLTFDLTFVCDPGELALIGGTIAADIAAAAAAALLELVGADVTLAQSGEETLTAEPGTLGLTGATVTFDQSALAEPGAVSLDGADVAFPRAGQILAEPGELALGGGLLFFGRGTQALPGSLSVSGPAVAFSTTLFAEAGALALQGADVDLEAAAASIFVPPGRTFVVPEPHRTFKA